MKPVPPLTIVYHKHQVANQVLQFDNSFCIGLYPKSYQYIHLRFKYYLKKLSIVNVYLS